MNQDLQVALCNIEVASQIQVYLLNSRQKDDTHVKKAAILKDVKILAQYINEQCKSLSSKHNVQDSAAATVVVESQSIDVPIVVKSESNPNVERTSLEVFSPPLAVKAEPIAPATPTKSNNADLVPETPSVNNISGFDRLVAKILSPAPASALRTPVMLANESTLPPKPIKIMPSFSLFNDDGALENNKQSHISTAEDNLLGLSTNHSITFNMSRPLSPIIGSTFGTPPRRMEAARMSGRLSGRYAGVNSTNAGDGAEDDVFGSLTLTSVGDWAKLREYLKTQDVKLDKPLGDEPAADFTGVVETIDVKDIDGAEYLDTLTEKKSADVAVMASHAPADVVTPSRAYEFSGLVESSVVVTESEMLTPQAAVPPAYVATDKLYPTPGRRKECVSAPPQPATEVIKLVTPTKANRDGSGALGSHLPTRTMAVTPSIKASFATKTAAVASPVAYSHATKYSTPVKSASPSTPSTTLLQHESSIVTPNRSGTSTPSASWGMVHGRNTASRTLPNKMDLRKSWKMAIPSSASGKKPSANQAKNFEGVRPALDVPDSTVKKLF